jgi:signal transduction histidine kinase/CheY-like chemotaxis protein
MNRENVRGAVSIFLVTFGLAASTGWIIWILWVCSQIPPVVSLAGQWEAEVRTGSQIEKSTLPVPFTYRTHGIDSDAQVSISIPIELDGSIQSPAFYAERPLRSVMFRWDGIPIASLGKFDDGVRTGEGSQSVLAVVPAHMRSNGIHSLDMIIQGDLGEGGIIGDLFLGEQNDLVQYQENKRILAIFLVAIFSFGSLLNLAVAATRRNRFEFISLGFLLGILAVYLLTRSDVWFFFFDSMQLKIHLRHVFSSFAACTALIIPAIITGQRNTLVLKGTLVLGISIGLTALLFPQTLTTVMTLNKVLGLFVISVCLKWLGTAAIQGKWDARLLMLIMLLLTVISLSDWPVQWGLKTSSTTFIFPAWLFFGIGVCAVIFIRFTVLADRYGQLMMQARDAIVVVKTGGQVVEANPAAVTLFGDISPGTSIKRMVKEEDHARLEQHLRMSQRRQEELRIMGPEGEFLDFESLATDLPLGERMLVLREISARKELERSLLNAARMETVGLVAGGIAHDFNNILTTLIGRLHMTLKNPMPQNAKHLRQMDSLLQRMTHMVRRLLVLSQGGMDIPGPIFLADVVKDSIPLVESMLPSKVLLEISLDEELPGILGSKPELEQVLLNLVLNSRDSMRSDGGKLWIEVYKNDSMVCLAVEDEGCGIPAEIREQIWKPFFSTKKEAKVVGIGLFVVSRVIEEHSGRIEIVEPLYSDGTRIELQLPAHHGNQSAVLKGALQLMPLRVLLVDDEPELLALMSTILKLRGFSVSAHADAESALEAFEPDSIDLLLSDVILPGRNGIDLAHECCRRYPKLNVVLVSGFMPKDMSEVRSEWTFLPKPFTAESLIKAIRRTMMPRA